MNTRWHASTGAQPVLAQGRSRQMLLPRRWPARGRSQGGGALMLAGLPTGIAHDRKLMREAKISGLPVVDGLGNLVGVVTESDFLRPAEIGKTRTAEMG
jgi:hypothetical protein